MVVLAEKSSDCQSQRIQNNSSRRRGDGNVVPRDCSHRVTFRRNFTQSHRHRRLPRANRVITACRLTRQQSLSPPHPLSIFLARSLSLSNTQLGNGHLLLHVRWRVFLTERSILPSRVFNFLPSETRRPLSFPANYRSWLSWNFRVRRSHISSILISRPIRSFVRSFAAERTASKVPVSPRRHEKTPVI